MAEICHRRDVECVVAVRICQLLRSTRGPVASGGSVAAVAAVLPPITLSKLALFSPAWLFLLLLSSFLEARTAVVLSLFLPISAGVILVALLKLEVLSYQQIIYYFGTVNFRINSFSSIALDVYNDFFSTHDHTHFCQVLLLKPFMRLPAPSPVDRDGRRLSARQFECLAIRNGGHCSVRLVAPVRNVAHAPGDRPGKPSVRGSAVKFCPAVERHYFAKLPEYSADHEPVEQWGGHSLLLWYLTPRTLFEEASQPNAH